jgi:hypothetical protein
MQWMQRANSKAGQAYLSRRELSFHGFKRRDRSIEGSPTV